MVGTWNLDPKFVCITQKMNFPNIWKLLSINCYPNGKGYEKIVYRSRKTNSSSVFDMIPHCTQNMTIKNLNYQWNISHLSNWQASKYVIKHYWQDYVEIGPFIIAGGSANWSNFLGEQFGNVY